MRGSRKQETGSRIIMALLLLLPALFSPLPSLAWAQPVGSGPPESFVTGQTISLDLKGVDILDVLKLLSQKSGLNFVAGHNVTGRVTMFVKDVDVWEAFEMIVDANDLAYERRGEIVNVMTSRDYELLYGERFQGRTAHRVIALKFAKANQVATALNQLKSSLGRVVVDEGSNTIILDDSPGPLAAMDQLVTQLDRPTETRIYTLNYAEAEKLKEKLQEFLTPGVGTFSFDARTNKVVLEDLKEIMPKLDQIIRALDTQDGEVLIDAKIVEVELTDNFALGIDWQRALGGIDTAARSSFGDVVTGDPLSGATGVALKFIKAPKSNDQIVMEALKKYGKVETISNPRITVSNNQEAKILVGTKEAFVTVNLQTPSTGSTVATPDVKFVDVGTKLFVTPSIKSDGHIKLKVRPEVSSATSQTFETSKDVKQTVPIVTTTEAETNVVVKSGSTLIIGGLIKTKNNRTQNQIPVLGDIPVFGMAFRGVTDDKKKTEMVVFLTPQIVSSSGQHVTTFPFESAMESIRPGDVPRPNPVPASYQALIRALLSSRVTQEFRSTSVGPGSVELSFVLTKDGRVLGQPEIISPQGDRFVTAARTALEAMTPLPAFPEGSWAEQVRFRVAVDYRAN